MNETMNEYFATLKIILAYVLAIIFLMFMIVNLFFYSEYIKNSIQKIKNDETHVTEILKGCK